MKAKNLITADVSALPAGAKAFTFITLNLGHEALASVVRFRVSSNV